MPAEDDLPAAVGASLEHHGAGVVEGHRHPPLAGVRVFVGAPEVEAAAAEVVVEGLLQRDLAAKGGCEGRSVLERLRAPVDRPDLKAAYVLDEIAGVQGEVPGSALRPRHQHQHVLGGCGPELVDGDLVELGGPGLRRRGHRDHAIPRGGRCDRQRDGHGCQPTYQANAAPHRHPLLHPWRGQPIAWLLLLALCAAPAGRALGAAWGSRAGPGCGSRRAAGVGVRGRPGLAALPGRSRAGKPDRLAALVADRLAPRLLPLVQGMLMGGRGVALGRGGGGAGLGADGAGCLVRALLGGARCVWMGAGLAARCRSRGRPSERALAPSRPRPRGRRAQAGSAPPRSRPWPPGRGVSEAAGRAVSPSDGRGARRRRETGHEGPAPASDRAGRHRGAQCAFEEGDILHLTS